MAQPTERRARIGYAVAAIVDAALLLAINAHETWLPWTRGAVTETFADALWAVNLALWVQLLGNAMLVVSHPPWFRHMAEFGFALVTVIGAGVLYEVFPFDFQAIGQPWLAVLARVVLILGLVGGGVAMVVAAVRIGRGGGTTQRPADLGV